MSNGSQVQTYQRTRVLTGRPENLQLMLYDGALRFCEEARLALAAGDRERLCAGLERARRIVLYLAGALRPEVAPDLCALVATAYQFIYQRLVEAGLSGGSTALDEAIGVLSDLRRTWADLLAQCRRQPPVAAPTGDAEAAVRFTG